MGLVNLLVCVLVIVFEMGFWVSGNVVFKVHHKFSGSKNSLTVYKEHDYNRRRILSAVDLPLDSPTSAGLYFTKIKIGTPSRDFHVPIDTGSDLLWVNCAGCVNCPKKSDLGIPLALYDPLNSSSAKMITCGEEFCSAAIDPSHRNCLRGSRCPYLVRYADGSSTRGFLVTDTVQLDRVSGNLQTDSMKGRISFGCGSQQLMQLGSTQQALDGVLGFGQSNSSIISQLALAKKVKKTFSHCLSGYKGGIYAIGEVVEPKVQTTPIMPNHAHFNIELMAIDVGGDFIDISSSLFNTPSKYETIIDSGTTLAYFPDRVYDQLMEAIMAAQPNADYHTTGDFRCTKYSRNVDYGFPVITFHFADSLQLKVYPHQYLFRVKNKDWCIGFLANGMNPHAPKDMTLLGDILLTDKLVTYNMEDHTIGWTEYDCSSSIKVKDEETGRVYEVGAHDLSSSGSGRTCGPVFILMVFIMATKMQVLTHLQMGRFGLHLIFKGNNG
ncbi:aspartic proteinase-like protein 2 [Tanacetum coccineum]